MVWQTHHSKLSGFDSAVSGFSSLTDSTSSIRKTSEIQTGVLKLEKVALSHNTQHTPQLKHSVNS